MVVFVTLCGFVFFLFGGGRLLLLDYPVASAGLSGAPDCPVKATGLSDRRAVAAPPSTSVGLLCVYLCFLCGFQNAEI